MSLFVTNFSTIDTVIVVAYLLGSIFIGIWANRYVGNLSDYLVAGRTLRLRLALATMTGTELGLVTVMYSSEMGFTQQYASLYLPVYEFLALLIIGLTGLVVYRLRETAVLTIPEYYEIRYSRGVRVLGAVMMVVSGVLNMGLFLKAGSQFLTAICGLEGEYLKLVMTGLLLLVLFYTVLGGMVSVVITDLVQFVILGLAMLLVTGFVVSDVGLEGFQKVVTEHNGYYDPTSTVNPSDPTNPRGGIGPLMLLAQAVILFTALMLWPAGVSRTLAVRTSEIARKLYLWSTIPFLARRSLPVLWGIAAYSFFLSNPELMAQLEVAIRDDPAVSTVSAMPLYLARIIPAGLLGLVVAGMVAAFMSTHDSYLLCWSGVITQDIVAPLFGPLSQKQRILTTRIGIVLIGIALLVWGLWYEVSTELWNYMAITGTVYLAGVLPVVVGGLYWRRGSSAGAYIALLGGLTGLLALGPCVAWINSQPSLTSWGEVRSEHLMLASFVVSLAGYLAGSLLLPDPPRPATTANVAGPGSGRGPASAG
ncbi:MAG: sodium:solute symporter family protein [Planctomycetaceae bacterium]|nr:sodium:solute symporter family protein [Planctomycetaceae bacterium]